MRSLCWPATLLFYFLMLKIKPSIPMLTFITWLNYIIVSVKDGFKELNLIYFLYGVKDSSFDIDSEMVV